MVNGINRNVACPVVSFIIQLDNHNNIGLPCVFPVPVPYTL